MSRTLLVGVALALGGPVASSAQPLEVPAMSEEERWDRASYNTSLFATVYLQKGLSTGMTAAEVGVELASHFGPWPGATNPQEMATTILRNWRLWRALDFQVEHGPNGTVLITASRPYSGAIERYSHIGVTVDEFDAMFAAFHEAIAGEQGLSFDQVVVDEDTVRMTVGRRPG